MIRCSERCSELQSTFRRWVFAHVGTSPRGECDDRYEHVVRDIAGTVTIPSPVGITLNPDALITR